MKYLVTDPCLVVPNEDWDDFNEQLDWSFGADLGEPYEIKNIGKVLKVMSTNDADGRCKVEGYELSTDTGTLSITHVEDDYKNKHEVGALVDSLPDAMNIMVEACSRI